MPDTTPDDAIAAWLASPEPAARISPFPDLAGLRRLLDDMRALATREGIYNGNRAVLHIVGSVEPLLDAAALLDEVRAQVTRGALCPMCSTGMTRQTVGMVCQVCGTDYGRPGYASLRRDSEQTSKGGVLSEALAVRAERDALADRLAAAEVAARGYRERAERAEETMLLAVKRADTLAAKVERVRVFAEQTVSDCDDGYGDGYELRPYARELLTILDADLLRALDKEPQP